MGEFVTDLYREVFVAISRSCVVRGRCFILSGDAICRKTREVDSSRYTIHINFVI